MYKFNKAKPTTLKVNEQYTGMTIEAYVRKLWTSGEPIEATGNVVFYPDSEGVPMEVNVRTDRFDAALLIQEQAKREVAARNTSAAPIQDNTEPAQGSDGGGE